MSVIEKRRCQSTVSSLEAQIARIPWSRRMTEVERPKSNTLQAAGLRRGAENYNPLKIWIDLKAEVAQLQAHCSEFWICPEPTQNTRDEVHLSPEPEWLHMEEDWPVSAATGRGGVGSDVTPFMEGVEPSSFSAPGCRLPVHLHGFCSLACLGDLSCSP